MQPIFIGDIQGCAAELDEILERASRTFGDEGWCAWFVGDLVNRGPGNLRVLERVRRLVDDGRARCVLGNHDIALIEMGLGLRRLRRLDTVHDVLESREAEGWVHWLRALPLVEVTVLGETTTVMVHAAVHPDWQLEDVERAAASVAKRLGSRDPERARALLAGRASDDPDRDALDLLTRCRSVGLDGGGWSSRAPNGRREAWHVAWARRGHDYGVVYGHWALQGLHVAPGLRGLDTGCVHHGRPDDGFLTAWVPTPDAGALPFSIPDDRFWQVRARQPYYALVLNERSPDG